jgi:hypothetical protein
MFLPKTFRGGGYEVTINADRSIRVRPGDWLSKYSKAIYGDFVHIGGFKRKTGNQYTAIANVNVIHVGETLYHPGPLPGEPATPPAPGVSPAPGAPPAPPTPVPKPPDDKVAQVCKPYKRAALLTCVTNALGVGPGHSAIILDDEVFTFERVIGASMVSDSSGWLRIKTVDYLKKNTFRPVVIQELEAGKTNASLIYEYIAMSDMNDEDYLSSGVCSHAAINALSAGLPTAIDPWGVNTPHAIYVAVKNSGYVSSSYYTFPNLDTRDGLLADAFEQDAKRNLIMDFQPECKQRKEPPPVLSW